MNKIGLAVAVSAVVVVASSALLMKSENSEEESMTQSLESGALTLGNQTNQVSSADAPPYVPGSSNSAGAYQPIEVEAWSLSDRTEMLPGDIKAHIVDVDVTLTEVLNTEDAVSISLPEFEQPIVARISDTYNEAIGVQVWKGDITYDQSVTVSGNVYEGHSDDNIVIARGKSNTHVTVATREGTYTVVYDNATGRGTLVNEADIIEKQDPDFEDAVTYVPAEEPLPAL